MEIGVLETKRHGDWRKDYTRLLEEGYSYSWDLWII